MRKPEQLRSSQLRIAKGIMDNPEYMVAADMGVGKTAATLTAFRELLDTMEVNHILVIAPLLVAEEAWPDEIEAWTHTACLSYEVLTGPPDRREQRARRLPEVSIINRENIAWLISFWGDDWPYDMVAVDEMSSFKSPTKRNKPTKKVIEDRTNESVRALPPRLSPARGTTGTISIQASYSAGRIRSFIAASTTANDLPSFSLRHSTRVSSTPALAAI